MIARHDLPAERGRLKCNRYLQVERTENLWVIGDCAAVPMANGQICPPTAQFAQRQGTLAGRNIVQALAANELKPFAFKGLGELAAIGHRKAVAEIFGVAFSGFFAWWMWRSIYLMKLPGFQRKMRVLLDWTFDLFFPRDVNLLTPQYSKQLKDMHLESGDTLFFWAGPRELVH